MINRNFVFFNFRDGFLLIHEFEFCRSGWNICMYNFCIKLKGTKYARQDKYTKIAHWDQKTVVKIYFLLENTSGVP